MQALEQSVAQLQTLVMQAGSGAATVSSEVRRLREQSSAELAEVRAAAVRAEASARASANACAAHELGVARGAKVVQQQLDALTHSLRVLSEQSAR